MRPSHVNSNLSAAADLMFFTQPPGSTAKETDKERCKGRNVIRNKCGRWIVEIEPLQLNIEKLLDTLMLCSKMFCKMFFQALFPVTERCNKFFFTVFCYECHAFEI